MVVAVVVLVLVVLGLLVAAAVRLPLGPSMLLVGLFALFHGHAHGTEAWGGAWTFTLGFVAATVLLHGAGIGLGGALAGQRPLLARGLGGVLAAAGLVLLGGFS